ncbi:flagellin [Cribrihabitans neustonicus]|uniref:flagellin n=1 Tax=Cribrihabitans neustonicus TaxID=1429085 RepID=UPI003B5AB244
MIIKSYGDMAQHLFLRSRNAELKENISTLSEEFATGKTANITERLGGDFTYLADIENTLSRLDSYKVANGEVQLFATATQGSLEKIQSQVLSLRNDILSMSPSMDGAKIDQFSSQARQQLESAISSLNGWAGGRSLFAGTATNVSPLDDADTLMTALVAEVGGLTTSDDIIQAVKDWFADPAGFDTVMYNGSASSLQPVQVGEGEQVSLGLRADDPDLKHALQSYAIAILANEDTLGIGAEVQVEMMRSAGMELATSNDTLIAVQADVGFIEGRLEAAKARTAATKTSLSIAKNNLISADPFETYTRLEEAQVQLEGLYTVTSRSANLSLLNYIS